MTLQQPLEAISTEEAESRYAEQQAAAFVCTTAAWSLLHGARLPAASAARWLDVQLSSDSASALLAVPEELPCFTGHFPGQPLLPGVLQLVWARELLACWQPATVVDAVRQIKFRRPIEPPAVLRVVLHSGAGKIAARIELPVGTVADWSFVPRQPDTPGTD